MILTTTSTIEGKVPTVYLGVIGAEVIFGAFFIKDWLAQGTDAWGGRNHVYEKVFEDARIEAVRILEQKAIARGASAVLNVRFDYSVLGSNNGMMMVAATGTCVALNLTKEERAREEALEKVHTEAFFVQIGDKQRGPFSIAQLRELVASARISEDDYTQLEDGTLGPQIASLFTSAPSLV